MTNLITLNLTTRLLIALSFVTSSLFAQSTSKAYQYKIDLVNLKDGKVKVWFSPPKNRLKEGIFVLPRMVPGYYDAMNFGKYISNLRAVDLNGKNQPVQRIDTNSWRIADLRNTALISYEVTQGWKHLLERTGGAKSPASKFSKDSLFIINYNSLVGYFQELKTSPYKLRIFKNKKFFASSALRYASENDTTDVVNAADYRHLVDAPVMYCVPDTAWLKVGDTNVLISFYSQQNRSYSKVLAEKLQTILQNQKDYLGGSLPVKNYAFLIYHETLSGEGLIGDGLEHSQSTVCLYSSKTLSKLPAALEGVASHEFFHILTPLNIHSKEIQNFDFLHPVLSQHLWLYEGMTEYQTIHMPAKQRLESLEDFCTQIEAKVKGMGAFNNSLSLTEMSTNAIQRQDQYLNFYQKGALIGLCLDIKLRFLSAGKMGTQELMHQLMKKYGPRRAFKDEELFGIITGMTYPELGDFFKRYVQGKEALPLKNYLLLVGLELDEKLGSVHPVEHPSSAQVALRRAWINH